MPGAATAGDSQRAASGWRDHPASRLRHRGSVPLTGEQLERRRKAHDRIEYAGPGVWRWTGQAKTARGSKYPQIALSLGGGVTHLANARHIVFYLATGWVHPRVQQYRAKDGDPMNVHPDNLLPVPPLATARSANNFWSLRKLREYFG
jgi:hypothetical protein